MGWSNVRYCTEQAVCGFSHMGRPLRLRKYGCTKFGIHILKRNTKASPEPIIDDSKQIKKAPWVARSNPGDTTKRGNSVKLFGSTAISILIILFNFILMFSESLPIEGETEISPYRVHLQTATASELELLPGIGPAIAERIIVFRLEHEINTPDDLIEIHGIGQKKIDGIRRLIRQEQSEQ
jgi:hypothetical protein